jgi:hypothetical protein
VSNLLLDEMEKVLNIAGKAPAHAAGTADDSQGDRIYRVSRSIGCCLGDETGIAGGGCRSLGKPIDLVVVHQIGNIMIASGGMDKAVATLPIAIPIAAGHIKWLDNWPFMQNQPTLRH